MFYVRCFMLSGSPPLYPIDNRKNMNGTVFDAMQHPIRISDWIMNKGAAPAKPGRELSNN